LPAASRIAAPLHVVLDNAVLVAGPAALATLPPGRTDAAYLSRLPLRRSGVAGADGSLPPLATSLYRHRRFAALAGPTVSSDDERLEGTSIFGGIVSQHFGHVVTQSLGRLWAGRLAPDAPILFLPETPGVTALPGFLTDLARSLGVTNPLRLVPGPTVADRLILPQDTCNLSHRPTATPWFLDWLASHRPAPPPGPVAPLYVSRSRLGAGAGQYLQETVLEAALAASGYRIFHPQDHAIDRQIDAYQSADRLIFADGSAAHLWSLVARPDQTAAIILRRTRDREFGRWFRSLGAPVPQYLDHGLADFWRRGDGPGRSVALLDLPALWTALRDLGYHADPARIGDDPASLVAWIADLPHRRKGPLVLPVTLDPRSREILALRRHAALRPRPTAL
jgi:hypothetical protein